MLRLFVAYTLFLTLLHINERKIPVGCRNKTSLSPYFPRLFVTLQL